MRRVMSTARIAIITTSVNLPVPLTERSNQFLQVIEAKTPHAAIGVEGDDPRINSKYVL